MSYKYVKAPPGYTLKQPVKLRTYLRTVVSAIFLTVGIAAFTSVVYPLVYYQARLAPRLVTGNLISPVLAPIDEPLTVSVKTAQAAEPLFVPEMINTTLDYTDSDTWFPAARAQAAPVPTSSYALSIPALGIRDALVMTTNSDLKKSLIHYPGTALPGDLGNTVIFGHSVLPQFFNPTNYISIFSTLHTLSLGQQIVLSSDNVQYRYQITDIYEVMPDNLSPLAQSFNSRSLTLITCTPPGTYLRRLIVKAELL